MRKIRSAAVLGSGVMGGGIAALLASAGVRTLMLDIMPPEVEENREADPKLRNRIVKAGFDQMVAASPSLLMHPSDADRISIGNFADDFDKIAECDWIIEVVKDLYYPALFFLIPFLFFTFLILVDKSCFISAYVERSLI